MKAVISDIGGVVIRFDDNAYFSYLSELSGHSQGRVKGLIRSMVPAFELGRMRPEQFERRIAKELGIGMGEVGWLGFYKEHIKVDVDMTDLIGELHRSYITGYITNIDKTKYSYFTRLFGKEMFDYGIASCNVHLRKPDPMIYRKMLGMMKIRPGEAVFIDDRRENVGGARRMGINSILYKNRRQLDISLSKLLEN